MSDGSGQTSEPILIPIRVTEVQVSLDKIASDGNERADVTLRFSASPRQLYRIEAILRADGELTLMFSAHPREHRERSTDRGTHDPQRR